MVKYIGLVISDIHVGAMNLEKLHNEYVELFIKYIHNMDKLDFVIVDGDFFDHKFYLNDNESIVAYTMLKELILACKEKDAVIRFVYGTESHECNQYDILSLLKLYDKINIVKYASEEELLPNLQILYLPEEYVLDKNEYYSKFFVNTKKYDYVFGHGVIREVMTDAAVHMENSSSKSTTNKRKKVPVFTSAELTRVCKGQVFFGHYHLNIENDNIISVGSFSRWKFGEEGRKGFYQIKCNTEKSNYDILYKENTLADSYRTITFGYKNEVFADEEKLQESLMECDRISNYDQFNHIRYIFNIPKDIENPEACINLIKEKYKTQQNVKVEMVHGYIEDRKTKQKEALQKDNEKYSFIYDKNLKIEDVVARFISIEYNKEIPIENISSYLYKSLNEILE